MNISIFSFFMRKSVSLKIDFETQKALSRVAAFNNIDEEQCLRNLVANYDEDAKDMVIQAGLSIDKYMNKQILRAHCSYK